MRIIYKNLKAGEVKLLAENLDDLWSLSQIVETGDFASGRSFRKVKLGGESERGSVSKKVVFVKIEVEKVELSDSSLRISGIVREGSDDVPHGSYHTLDVAPGDSVSIVKDSWPKYQLERLDEAVSKEVSDVLVCVFERDNASFAMLKKSGYKMLADVDGEVERKDEKVIVKGEGFFPDLAKMLKEYVDRFSVNHVIVASPAFWKDDFMKIVKKKYPDVAKKITLATCSDTGKVGVDEVLKRDEVKAVLQKDRTAREINLVEELLAQIAKDNLAVYGFDQVKGAVAAKAVSKLLVVDEMIQKLRMENRFKDLDFLMHAVDKAGGEVHIIAVVNDGGKKLKGIGGIGAILRYKLNY